MRQELGRLLTDLEAKYLGHLVLDFPTAAELDQLHSLVEQLAIVLGRGHNQILGLFRSIKFLDRRYPKLGLLAFVDRLAVRIDKLKPSPQRRIRDAIEAGDKQRQVLRIGSQNEATVITLRKRPKAMAQVEFDKLVELQSVFEALTENRRTVPQPLGEWKHRLVHLEEFTTEDFKKLMKETRAQLEQEHLSQSGRDKLETICAFSAYRDVQFQEAAWWALVGSKVRPSLIWLLRLQQNKYDRTALSLTNAGPPDAEFIKRVWVKQQARLRQHLHRSKGKITSRKA
jgi:hypothetical protein